MNYNRAFCISTIFLLHITEFYSFVCSALAGGPPPSLSEVMELSSETAESRAWMTRFQGRLNKCKKEFKKDIF